MKRKRNSEDLQAWDLVLTDASGRSVKAHRALLMDKSEYFARILNDHNLTELQLNENYLIELIHYLYSHDSDYGEPPVHASQLAISPEVLYGTQADHFDEHQSAPTPPTLSALSAQDDEETDGTGRELVPMFESTTSPPQMEHSPILTQADIEVLMRMLALSNKYSFRQLYRNLINEINYKLGPHTAIPVYRCAKELGIMELHEQTRLMILSWLSQLQFTQEFLSLSEDSIRDIFGAEAAEIESDSKLDALSAWWSHNKQSSDMTDLWVKIMMST